MARSNGPVPGCRSGRAANQAAGRGGLGGATASAAPVRARPRQPAKPPAARTVSSSTVETRPSTAFRCGNRPKRRMIAWWPSTCCTRSGPMAALSATDRSWSTRDSEWVNGKTRKIASDRSSWLKWPRCSAWPAYSRARRLGGVHVAGAAEGIARELVKQDGQGQRALGAVEPVLVLSGGGGHVRVQEALPEIPVKVGILDLPQAFADDLSPVVHDLADGRARRCHAGSSRLKRAPPPSALAASRRPPCSAMMRRTMTRPRPEPRGLSLR